MLFSRTYVVPPSWWWLLLMAGPGKQSQYSNTSTSPSSHSHTVVVLGVGCFLTEEAVEQVGLVDLYIFCLTRVQVKSLK